MPNRAVSLALSTHPGPALAVTVAAVVLGVGVGLDPARVALLGLTFLLNQASIGLSNDWLDAARDRLVGRRDKPVAREWIGAAAVRNWAFATAVLAVIATIPLGVPATLAHAVFILSAWGYNLGLKGTPVSVLPYVVSFGLLPLIVTLALPRPTLAAPWAMGMGALLGVAAHFANVAPDLEDDRRTGVRGLPHLLGRRRGGVVTFLALTAASVLAVTGQHPTAAQWTGMVATLGIAAVGIVLVMTRAPSRWLFRLVLVAALIDVALLATSGGRLLA